MLPKINPFRLPMLMPDDGDGNGGGASNGNDGDGRDDQPLGDAGKRALDAERDRANAAEKREKDLQKHLDALEKAKQDDVEQKAKEQGEWQTLAEKREADLTSTKAELDTLTAELTVLREHVTKQYDAAVKDFPAVIKAFAPSNDAPLPDRLKWLATATEQAKELDKETPRGNGPDKAGKTPAPSKVESPVSMREIMNG